MNTADVYRSARSEPGTGSGTSLRGGQGRLASVDLVAAAAVIGSIDMIASGDTAFPGLTTSLANPEGDGSDLPDADLDALMGLTIDPRQARTDAADRDLIDLDLEQLLAIEVFSADRPPADLTLLAFEDLIEVDVTAELPEPLVPVIDLTEIALEILQDLQFGEEIRPPASAVRLVASLDLRSALDEPGLNDITLVDRTAEPPIGGTSDYVTAPPDLAATTVGRAEPALPIANRPPTARDEALNTLQDTAMTGNVLANDSDPDGDPLTILNAGTFASAMAGTVTLNADGSFAYAPPSGYWGADTFGYDVSDGHGNTVPAVASIDVAKVNLNPVAGDDSVVTDEDSAVIIDATANDSDPDGDPLSVYAVTQGAYGSVAINFDGTLTYTPDPDFNGTDTFTYTLSDSHGGKANATVTVIVAPVNDAPHAKDDGVSVLEDATVTGNVLTNDGDPDGDALTVTSTGTITTAAGGTVVMAADGSFTYAPAADYDGPDSFLYTIADGNGGTASARVAITVEPVNDAPVANVDGVSGLEDADFAGNVLTNDADPDGDVLIVTNTGTLATGKGGTVVMAADGSFVYTPAANYNGPDSFLYTISDGNGGTATARVGITVAPVNDAPFAGNDRFAGDEDTVVAGNVLTNDSDPDGDPLVVASTGPMTTAKGGTVIVNDDGSFSYTPPADFHGLDSFTYRISDGNGGTATATAEIAVAAVNDAPVAADDGYTATQGVEVRGNLLDNDHDPDGDALAVTSTGLFSTAIGGQVQIAGDGTFAYRAPTSFTGTDTFTYTVADGAGGTATATVTMDVLPPNTDPVAVNDAYDVAVDGAVSGNVLANDRDADGDALTVTNAGTQTTAGGGIIALMADGSFDYKPAAGFVGSDGLTYAIADGRGGTATASITFSVTAGVTLNGTPNTDRLVGTVANDIITANGGDDLLIGLAGADTLAGGAGIDTVSYEDSSARVEISLESGTAFGGDAEGDFLTGIENVIGSAFDDHIRGDIGDNVLWGGAGNDGLLGGDGDDTLIGGAGADLLSGGAGIDRADYSGSDAGIDIDLFTGDGFGGHAEGDFLENVEDIIGSAFADRIAGDIGTNTLHGGDGNDILWGGTGDDFLFGGAGDDTLDGEQGADVFNGGLGNDTLFGGAGRDTFIIGPGSGGDTDTIVDFTGGEDVVDLSAFGLTSFTGMSVTTDGSGGMIVTFPTGDSIVVLNFDPTTLTPADIII